MENIKPKSTTKLRGNEALKIHCQIRPNYDSGFQASDSSQNVFPKPISETKHQKHGSRGLAIQELAESMSSNAIENSNLNNFSNNCIESHFKHLREENEKKLKEKNEKIWGKFIRSDRSA